MELSRHTPHPSPPHDREQDHVRRPRKMCAQHPLARIASARAAPATLAMPSRSWRDRVDSRSRQESISARAIAAQRPAEQNVPARIGRVFFPRPPNRARPSTGKHTPRLGHTVPGARERGWLLAREGSFRDPLQDHARIIPRPGGRRDCNQSSRAACRSLGRLGRRGGEQGTRL